MQTVLERFWKKVLVSEGATCWEWQGAKSRATNGFYGYFCRKGKNMLAHRVAYELMRGPIPAGMTIDHLCRNTLCVNPAHLEPVTYRKNTRRGVSPVAGNFAKTHCPQGHAYTEENTYYVRGTYGQEWRQCRECGRTRARERQRRKAQEPVNRQTEGLPSHCVHGHSFTEDNTVWIRNQRVCRTCKSAIAKRWRDNHPNWWEPYKIKRAIKRAAK